MNSETVEEFLARGGQIQKSSKETTLEDLLFNEGILDHNDANAVKDKLNKVFTESLDEQFTTKK
jgi:uncharacterized protein YicC (UPF0701 family)